MSDLEDIVNEDVEDYVDACFMGDVDEAQALLDRGVDVNAQDIGGHTGLVDGAACGHSAIVALLIQRNADVQRAERDGRGETALIAAARTGRVDIACMLLGAGADPSTEYNGATALQCAEKNGKIGTAKLLRQHQASRGSTAATKQSVARRIHVDQAERGPTIEERLLSPGMGMAASTIAAEDSGISTAGGARPQLPPTYDPPLDMASDMSPDQVTWPDWQPPVDGANAPKRSNIHFKLDVKLCCLAADVPEDQSLLLTVLPTTLIADVVKQIQVVVGEWLCLTNLVTNSHLTRSQHNPVFINGVSVQALLQTQQSPIFLCHEARAC